MTDPTGEPQNSAPYPATDPTTWPLPDNPFNPEDWVNLESDEWNKYQQ